MAPLPAKSRSRIEIHIPSRPKRLYCSGPPPPAISLVPPRDSTAYIVSKLVLPSGLETDKTTQRRLYYTVGWTDLPNAKVTILATRILDYVSPRELEDWEYNDFLRREEETRLAGVEAAATPVTKKKPGRPRKRPSDSHRAAEAAVALVPVVLDSEAEAELAEKIAGGGPSLSTPSKRKLEELLGETEAEDTGTDSENAALVRRLYTGGDEPEGFTDAVKYEEAIDFDSDAIDLVGPASTAEDVSTRASSLAAASRAPFSRASPALPNSLKPSSAGSSAVIPAAAAPHQRSKPQWMAAARGSPVPLPRQGLTPSSRTSTRASTPRPSASIPHPPTNGTAPPRREPTGFTPVSVRPSSFTPAALPAPNPGTLAAASSSADTTPQPSATPRSGRKKRKKQKPAEKAAEEEDEGWAVKRLEGDKHDYDEAGNLVRFFKVLWEGDWPAWQNPSWEPEENISIELKEEYLAKQEAKMKNGYLTSGKSPAKSAIKRPPPPSLPKKRYSSVAEAFEGDINESGDIDPRRRAEEDDDDRDGEERLVVTDEPRPKAVAKPAMSFTSFDHKVAMYRNAFGRSGS